MDQEDTPVRRHLMIAGTGRAGTSFLVRYLTELGFDTAISRLGEAAAWDEDANAGLEELPIRELFVDQPYVIKSPWLYQIIDDLLADKMFAADAVIIPVRDLVEAAASRSIIERRAVHQNAPWMSGWDQNWEEWGYVPGGNIYSLNPIDQGRLLAVGFHHLVQRLIAADIPIIFLAFPRITEDADYLFERLRPILPPTVDRAMAGSAHHRLAEPAKVRIGNEINAESWHPKTSSAKIVRYEAAQSLDAIAIRRELRRLRKQLADANCVSAKAQEKAQLDLAASCEEGRLLCSRIAMLENTLAQSVAAAAEESRSLRATIDTMENAVAEAVAATEKTSREKVGQVQILQEEADRCYRQLDCLTDEMSQLRRQADLDAERRRELEAALLSMSTSRSWRLTSPYRTIGLTCKRFLAQHADWILRVVVRHGFSGQGRR